MTQHHDDHGYDDHGHDENARDDEAESVDLSKDGGPGRSVVCGVVLRGEGVRGEVVDLSAARARRHLDEDQHDDTGEGAEVVEGVVLDADELVRKAPAVAGARSRRELVPSHLLDRETLAGLVADSARRAGFTVAFHALRLPLYWLRLLQLAPRGAWRIVRALFWWASDGNGRQVRRAVALGQVMGSAEATAFHRVSEQHRDRVRTRLAVLGAAVLAVTVVGYVLATSLAAWALLLAVGTTLAGIGALGRKPDERITGSAVSTSAVPRFTSDLILTALGSLGIAELNKHLRLAEAGRPGGEGVRFVGPIHRDGSGWRADLDLPPGVTAADVIEKRDRLASGLRRPLGCVWPEPDASQHEGRLILWVGDKALSAGKPVPWPLAKTGKVSLFEPFPIGVDQRGRPATLTLMYASMVIGATPRMGKTFTLRLLLLAAALDPLAEVHPYDLKGSGDLSALETVAHRYRAGDEEEDLAYLMADLRALVKDMRRRYTVIRSLPRSECPENKVTPDLAARRELGLHPVVLGIDECQFLFEHPVHGKDAETLITDLVKRGPAVGIVVLVATQRPDAKSLPTGISANAILRYCLRVMGQTENDMVLGTSMYKAGIRATTFTRSDLGIGYLVGEGAEPVIVKTAYLDNPAAAAIAARARTARIAAGRLTGHAAGIDPDTDENAPVPTVLDDLAEVMATGPEKEWSEVLVQRLAEYRPDVYTGWDADDLAGAVAPFGLKTIQVGRRDGAKVLNRRGLTQSGVHAALTERDDKRGA
ncbi:S-DNA-T family DNA segregation ATPase FtsK/SpoIIIE [Kineococcus xinjiangensis]|uniref:S-DNA-T family DNA segregation ATPase FtsK/SpoIIIE n=1 Tax=Kineococcus xinjiangensis TaxID=512762 RepID=A0A2S6ICA1_9ACTN|nr:FtsK/SpoIIIE domain-containing protein [Kineococcus xinjiangensis]PPK90844.1 S-DNA-T family DNA segregation ATPase FtsK/SpoIIIE [Kineococcus xinjiangensis]